MMPNPSIHEERSRLRNPKAADFVGKAANFSFSDQAVCAHQPVTAGADPPGLGLLARKDVES